MDKSQRKLNRFSDYDYNLPGYYFITICTQNKLEYFGQVENQKMILNQYGKIAGKFWADIPKHYQNVAINEFIIMPNHIHGIIEIKNNNVIGAINVGTGHCPVQGAGLNNRTGHCPVPTRANEKNYGLISKIINSYKNVVIKQIRQQFNDYEFQWQRSFYDHVILDDEGLYNIREYIINNPIVYKINKNRNV